MKTKIPDVQKIATLIDIVQWQALHQTDQVAYIYLVDGETNAVSLTYGELEQRAQMIGAMLQHRGAANQPVLLCYPPGLEYISAFFGCLYAGAIAVPAYPPDPARLQRSMPRLRTIMQDSQATIVLTTQELVNAMQSVAAIEAGAGQLQWIATDSQQATPQYDWHTPASTRESLAFLMYTSGSTGDPKGVMVSHGNALHNLAAFPGFEHRSCTGFVSWLPLFHDLGLLMGVLHPLYRGVPSVLMSPTAFVQRPLRWLQAISRYQASATGGPNFAYDLCIRKTTPAERATLDLRSWHMALNGAEPVRQETLEQFTATFAPCGFRHEAWYPSYGLAEATATVAGGWQVVPPQLYTVQQQPFTQRQVVATNAGDPASQTIVGCGRMLLEGQQIVIVDPDTHTRCRSDQVGEIWLSGASVAQGYWNRPAETEQTFRAYLSDTNEGPFLRTGDLGFLHNGELFITGRLKDLIIIRGRNLYPQDIELTLEQSHPALRPGGSIAVGIDSANEERLAIVAEVQQEAELDSAAISAAIRQAIAEQHDVEVYYIALVKTGTIPKTSSGKQQRQACRAALLAGTLETLATWQAPLAPVNVEHAPSEALEQSSLRSSGVTRQARDIERWLIAHLSERLGVNPAEIDVGQPFARYGLASFESARLIGELETWLARPLPLTLVWSYPTIEALARYLAGDTPNTVLSHEGELNTSAPMEPVAIVGIGCRFPNAANPQAFWELLCGGQSAITEVPSDRWDTKFFYNPDPNMPGKVNGRWGGFVENIDRFDAHFFGISPREATHLDPRQRLMLETSWEALEDAGIPADSLAGSKTGVFVAVLTSDYNKMIFTDLNIVNAYSGVGTANSIVANRISYFFDFHGPSVALDTACSGSLVAMHLACQSLRNGESTLALAGGVSVHLIPDSHIFFTKAGILSPHGRCNTFDSAASGTVHGEGAGVVVLKLLSRALADGDNIYAVIRGSAVNSDGRSNGIMAPNVQAQEALLWEAYRNAGVVPGQVQYIEAHGTGTRLGDPIEVQALSTVLKSGRAPEHRCAIGSVKTNIGHLEPAAGVAGVVKVALALKHRLLPPSLHLREPNPLIPFADIPIFVQQELGAWPVSSEPLIAGISGFGIGGTNAHIVLAEAPPPVLPPAAPLERPRHLLCFSAKSSAALQDQARHMNDFLAQHPDLRLADLCFSANTGRVHFTHRIALSAADSAELQAQLNNLAAGQPTSSGLPTVVRDGTTQQIAFLFTGQGAQYPGMGRQLYATQPAFRQALDRCAEVLHAYLDVALLDLIDPPPDAPALIDQTIYTQPALFAFEYALAMMWQSWGIKPSAVLGHSLGEYVAACLAGVFSLEDALWLVTQRGRLMQSLSVEGAMVSIAAAPELVQAALQPYAATVGLAAINGPQAVVISGVRSDVEAVVAQLQAQGITCKSLAGANAFHSPLLESALDRFEAQARQVQYHAPELALVSNLSGQFVAADQLLDAQYWRRHARGTVQFAAGLAALRTQGYTIFIEIGPRPTLTSLAQNAGSVEGEVWVASLRRGKDEWEQVLAGLARLYMAGLPIDWAGFDRDYTRQRIALPTYAWQRERYWFDQTNGKSAHSGYRNGRKGAGCHPLLGEPVQFALAPAQHLWEMDLNAQSLHYLEEHQVLGSVVMPGAAYIEMALAAGMQAFPQQTVAVTEVSFVQALTLSFEALRRVQFVLELAAMNEATFNIFSRPVDAGERAVWTLHASGKLRVVASDVIPTMPEQIEVLRARYGEERSREAHYQAMQEQGLLYGRSFQVIEHLWRRDGEALGRFHIADKITWEIDNYQIHPTLLDASFQIIAATVPSSGTQSAEVYLPAGVGSIRVYRRPTPQLWCHAQLKSDAEQQPDQRLADITLFDDDGQIVAQIHELRIQRMGSARLTAQNDPRHWCYTLEWQPESDAETLPAPTGDALQGSWLIFADADGIGASIAATLEANGASCLLVFPADHYQFSASERRCFIDPTHAETWQQFLSDVPNALQLPCRGIIHLWALDAAPTATLTLDTLDEAQDRGCRTVLQLIQSLARTGWRPLPRLWLVTRGSQALGSESIPVAVAQAPLWGMGRVIAQELPELWGGIIDIDPQGSTDDTAQVLAVIGQPGSASQVAFRDGQRYVARLLRATDLPVLAQPMQFRANASYLITGGLGGLGLQVSRWMVGQGARRLILMGRSKLPPRATWRQIDSSHPLHAQVAAIRELEALGAHVHLAAVDVTDATQLNDFITAYQQEDWPPIRGVVHAAGLVQDQLLLQMNLATFDTVLRPKVLGAWHLHQALAGAPLDFFVLFSSAAALLGTPGQANYAAGNAFMDALAHQRRAKGLPALSMNWGPWAEVGMAARLNLQDEHQGRGVTAMTPDQGLQTMAHLFRHAATQVAILIADWPIVAGLMANTDLLAQLLAEHEHPTTFATTSQHERDLLHEQLLLAEPAERHALVLGQLQQIVANILRLAPAQVEPEEALTTLGLDSLMAIELKNGVEATFGVSLSMLDLLQGANLTQLTTTIISQRYNDQQIAELLAQLEELSVEEVQALLGDA